MSEEASVKMFQIYSFNHQLQEPNLNSKLMLFLKQHIHVNPSE